MDMDKANDVTGAPYWLIVGGEDNGTCLLTFDSAGVIGGTDVLPVFSCREEAEILLTGELGSGWQVRESSNRELLSMLCDRYAAVKYVILDPWPGPGMEELVSLVGIGRVVFTDRVMGRGRSWFYARRSEESRNKARKQRGKGAFAEERSLPESDYLALRSGKGKRMSRRRT